MEVALQMDTSRQRQEPDVLVREIPRWPLTDGSFCTVSPSSHVPVESVVMVEI